MCLIDSLALHPAGRGHRPLALPLGLRARLLHHERAQTAQLRRPQPARHLLQESEGGLLRLLLPAAPAAASCRAGGAAKTASAEDVRLGARGMNDSRVIAHIFPLSSIRTMSPFASR